VSAEPPVATTPPLPEPQIDRSWVFINRDIKWELAPKVVSRSFEGSVNSTIVVFYPTGKFAMVGCTLYRDKASRKVSISAGDDFSVLKGTWQQSGDGNITVKATSTHTILIERVEQVQNWKIIEPSPTRVANSLDWDGQTFIPISNVENIENLRPMIADESLPPS
jgi:hypothetical protein